MNTQHSNRHFAAYGFAGFLGIAYFYWKNHQDRTRKDGNANALMSDEEFATMLVNCNQAASKSASEASKEHNKKCIYLDYNGTTPIYPPVVAAMLPYLVTHFGNPSSGHAYGKEPKRAIEEARTTLLTSCLGVDPASVDTTAIWFTGCGTESDNLAIQLALQSTQHQFQDNNKKPHIVTSNVEHPAIAVCLQALEKAGTVDVTYVPVETDGCVKAENVTAALTENTILVTLMLANNESGALQPVEECAQECRKRGILIHTDAAQAVGKVSCRLEDLGDPDMVSIVGHKIGAPKGIAALYVRPRCHEENGRSLSHSHGILLLGGGQEHGRRGGTENTPYIVGMATAAQLACEDLKKNSRHMRAMRTRLLGALEAKLSEAGIRCRVNGPEDPKKRLPNTLSVGLENVQSGDLLAEISDKVAASAGAACHSSGNGGISQVLKAMNVPEEFARGTLRLTCGPKTTASEIDRAAGLIAEAAIEQTQSDTI